MIRKRGTKFGLVRAVFGVFFLVIVLFSGVAGNVLNAGRAYAEPEPGNTSEVDVETLERGGADVGETDIETVDRNNVEEQNVDVETRDRDAESQDSDAGDGQGRAESEEDSRSSENGDTDGGNQDSEKKNAGTTESCKKSLGAIGWLVCPVTGKIAEAVDWLYEKIEEILIINPISMEDGSPIYEIWKYCRGITNIVFIIFFLVVIYSQLTGLGISNYGIKKALPKLIVVAIMVNLSFLICSLVVDVSNIVGSSLRGVFTAVEESTMMNGVAADSHLSLGDMFTAMSGGALFAIGAGALIAFELGTIWMLIPTVLGAIVAVASGLITIALRQAVVALLIMISPLAFVTFMLPNTEQLFKKWKALLTRMLVFYPLFSLLFGASQLAGFALIASASSGFGVLLGVAVQVFPLFFSWKLMKMSGTFLGDINTRLRGMAAKPLAANRAWADSHRQLSKQKHLASKRAYTPSLRLMQFMSNRRVAREEELNEHAENVKLRGQAYNVRRKYGKNGMPKKAAEEDYAVQAENMGYMRTVEWHKDNLNKGLGQLEAVKDASASKKARLEALDVANVKAADMLFVEKARGEKIEFDNAEGRHKRFENAINAHMDDKNGYTVDEKTGKREKRSDYKFHDFGKNDTRAAARARYSSISKTMEMNLSDIHYAAAGAAQAFDTQKKMVETKMGKYFELTPPTKDVEYRLNELTNIPEDKLKEGKKAGDNIDTIISGLRVLNQRGDTDLVKKQIDNLLNKKVGGGIELGTHASQSLASFLMFEVKDSDPFLRRFGKYINLETARAYNENERQVMNVTYDEYIKGYHDGEVKLVNEQNKTGRMYAKKAMKQLSEGTSLDNIERTALSNLDQSLKQAYGLTGDDSGVAPDVAGYLRKREEIQTSFEPAFLSASLKWLSGSEQMNSGVKFWTGYELKQKKDKNGNVIVDKNGDPEYSLAPVWESKEFVGHEDEVQKYYRRKTKDFFKDQTTGQILGMRTDYRDATMEHLLDMYLSENSEEGTADEKMREYEEARAEIQTRYSDKPAEEAKKLRESDLKKVKMDLAGRQLRKILGPTGKLKQIYRTRTSGTAINAKDWLRRWVNLDDEDALRREMNHYDAKKKKKTKRADDAKGTDSADGADVGHRIYTEDDRDYLIDAMRDFKDRIMDEEPLVFFEDTRGELEKWFGEDTVMVKKYDNYFNKEHRGADNIDLYKYLLELLDDPDNYPDA